MNEEFIAVPALVSDPEDNDPPNYPLDPSVRVFLLVEEDAFGEDPVTKGFSREYCSFGPEPDEHRLDIYINDRAAALTLATAILQQLNDEGDGDTVSITLQAKAHIDILQCEPLTADEGRTVRARWEERMEQAPRRKPT